jgi:hypothetical protein
MRRQPNPWQLLRAALAAEEAARKAIEAPKKATLDKAISQGLPHTTAACRAWTTDVD